MDNKKTETLIDQLLVLMNTEIEVHGLPIKNINFAFLQGEEDYLNAKKTFVIGRW